MKQPWDAADWTALRWYLDVHVIDDPRADDLLRLGELGWIRLNVTDTAYVETSAASDPTKLARLRAALSPFPVAHGPLVLDHSQLDMSVLGSQEDGDRIQRVYALLWPNNRFADDANQATATGRTRFRDALHVATAIRYGGTGFVTEDGKLLASVDRVAGQFDGFRIVPIDDATSTSLAAARHLRRRAEEIGTPDPGSLPAWP